MLYSAAGNSGDRLWYANDIYAWDFEVGDQGFQPGWNEAYAEAMEFSDGLIEMFQVAMDFSKDNQIPISTLVDSQGSLVQNQKYDGQVSVHFSNSEPATIYYTLDGSRPTFGSFVYSTDGVREPGSILTFNPIPRSIGLPSTRPGISPKTTGPMTATASPTTPAISASAKG